ncbi:MAG TPA: lysophospholipase [Myxococcota bacterium]|jgi:alpha-beta hydrolase superfamily lysophospholipase|nr:lysophospholipase [Myxococcota bacterium]
MLKSIVRRTEARLVGSGGLSLHRRAWLPPQPRRVIAVAHGYAEHAGRYDALGAWFAARGFAVHALDHRGHGRSEGPRGHVARFDDFLDDLERFLALVRGEHPDVPVTLLGHSMGGLIVASLLARGASTIDDAVLSAAALAFPPDMSRVRLGLARIARRIAPRLRAPSGLDPSGLSRDVRVVRAYLEDPLVFRHISASLACELQQAIGRLATEPKPIELPILVLHGGDDPIVPAEASRRYFGHARGPGSELRIYPKLRHEIFNEPEQEDVFRDVLQWLETREAAAG